MSISKRFINIIKTNRIKINDEIYLSQSDINNFLKNDTDDELSKKIAEANNQYFPECIVKAFLILEIEPTKDIDLVSLQFRNLMNKYHPDKSIDKNTTNTKQFFNNKTAEIITAYNKIKEHLEK